jgi:hypothetical protein
MSKAPARMLSIRPQTILKIQGMIRDNKVPISWQSWARYAIDAMVELAIEQHTMFPIEVKSDEPDLKEVPF